MKTKQDLLSMLFLKLSELQNSNVKTINPELAKQLKIELSLLYDILGEEIDEEYWKQIEKEIN